MCSLIPDPSERQQCYSVFGLDAGRMADYYDTVSRLEAQLSTDFHAAASGESDAEHRRQRVLCCASDRCRSSVLCSVRGAARMS